MKKSLFAAAALTLFSAGAQAAPIVLTFEGVGNLNAVGNFYAAQGVTFSPATLAIVDSDAGGTGNIANEPSPSTVMFFLDSNNAILNRSAGITTGFSFFYSSSTVATVSVWDGLDGTGNLLGSINVRAQFNEGCTGDPNGGFCNWSAAGVTFAGTARSINFGGTANQTAFDNITIGAGSPVVPEPTTWALMIGGFGLAGAALRRRNTTVAYA